MIIDPKVGDVVHFIDPAGWSMYCDTNPNVRYQITELPKPVRSKDGSNIPVLLKNMQTGKKVVHNFDTGVWTCWLARDEFLSKAYHAQEEAAVAG